MASTPARPLLSASLIVKDEEAMLPRCLAALRGVVDEIVVLDTGSTDRTVEIAEGAGAVVHRSGWYDDFGRSRNESIGHCTGRWVLIVDADEVLHVDDVAAFRRALARSADDALAVHVRNVEDHGGSVTFTHDPIRIFRRGRMQYEGRVHEQVVPIGNRSPRASLIAGVHLTHYGYVHDVIAARGKVDRNAALAEAAWRADPDDLLTRIELARALASTDRYEEALAHCEALRGSGHPAARHTALHLGLKVLIMRGDLAEAVAWGEEIRTSGLRSLQWAHLHGEALLRMGRHEEALAVVEEAPSEEDATGVHGTRDLTAKVDLLRAKLLELVDREEEAVDLLLRIAPEAPVSCWPPLVHLLRRRGDLAAAVDPFFEGLRLVGPARAEGVLAELTRGPVEDGEAFCEVLAARPEGLLYALAYLVANAARLPVDRASAWAAVARAAGLPDNCPLLARTRATSLPPLERLVAAAALLGVQEDERGRTAIEHIAAELVDDDLAESLYVIAEVAPDALQALVVGFATTQARALALADALVVLGAPEEAAAVLWYGLEELPADVEGALAISATLAQLQPQT